MIHLIKDSEDIVSVMVIRIFLHNNMHTSPTGNTTDLPTWCPLVKTIHILRKFHISIDTIYYNSHTANVLIRDVLTVVF